MRRGPRPFHWLLLAGVVGLLLVIVAFAASGGLGGRSPIAPALVHQPAAAPGAPASVAPAPTQAPTPTPTPAGKPGKGHGNGDGGGGD